MNRWRGWTSPERARERAAHRSLRAAIAEGVDVTGWSPYRLGSVQDSASAGTSSVRPPVTVGRLHDQALLAAAAGAEAVLLAVLSALVGLGPAGWLAGMAYGLGLWALLTAATWRAGTRTLGPAGLVTSTRAVLVGGVTALVTDRLWGGDGLTVPLVVLATAALVLDAVDGPVARRTGTVSALGARFDVEVDSVLVLVLSVYVAVLLDPWVVVIGALRYAFVAAGWTAPWLRSPLPTSFSAKTVAALQGIVLVVATADVLPRSLAAALAGGALALLVWSFTRSVMWLWCNARRPTTACGAKRGGVAARSGSVQTARVHVPPARSHPSAGPSSGVPVESSLAGAARAPRRGRGSQGTRRLP
jgi:phosphatidylglycerophosphate synthase